MKLIYSAIREFSLGIQLFIGQRRNELERRYEVFLGNQDADRFDYFLLSVHPHEKGRKGFASEEL